MNSNLLHNNEYKHWLKDLKQKVMQSQLKAMVKVNSTLLEFYWELGKEIVLRQTQASWSDGFLKQLSQDKAIGQQPVAQLTQIPWGHNLKIIAKYQNVT